GIHLRRADLLHRHADRLHAAPRLVQLRRSERMGLVRGLPARRTCPHRLGCKTDGWRARVVVGAAARAGDYPFIFTSGGDSMTMPSDLSNQTPMHPVLRAWLGAEIFFAFVASLATFFNPHDAATGFAWPIPVTVMAAVLGVFYMSSLPVTIWAVRMKYW